MFDYFFWGFTCVIAFAVFSGPICNFLEDRFVFQDDGYGRALTKFHDEGRAQGRSYQDATDQLFLREALARLRREASDAVARNPAMWFDELTKAKNDVYNFVDRHNPDLLPAFDQMLRGLSYGHILYPAEARIVDRQTAVDRSARPNEDQVAALRIVKPS
ncbi:hypothetical protein [Mesorhizobium sp.]|uniref:hypothetical protein n=1 Tax=Mesorhizobium sp. TaxID=1871066 RepID=UPI0011F485DE|nr:hypothetical protein [Mesorhizobium sp.]TIN77490.1 MAG: hypothetical protein E5Y09_17865 [Mesorhizobium sp.]